VVNNIVLSWFLTIPAAAVVAGGCYFIARALVGGVF
jgi:PiT family inorganic phosphate transporter